MMMQRYRFVEENLTLPERARKGLLAEARWMEKSEN